MQLSELGSSIREQRRVIDALTVEAKLVSAEGIKIQNEVKELDKTVLDLEQAAILLSSISEERQKEAQQKIELLVTQGLQKIFGEELSFHLVSTMRGKTPVVEFVIRTTLPSKKVIDTSVLDARGGGLAAVVGFLLRLVLLLLSKDKQASLIVLDETFAHVSDYYLPKLVEFLREVVDKSNTQIVMVTHEPAFIEAADAAYKFSLDSSGLTKVEAI